MAKTNRVFKFIGKDGVSKELPLYDDRSEVLVSDEASGQAFGITDYTGRKLYAPTNNKKNIPDESHLAFIDKDNKVRYTHSLPGIEKYRPVQNTYYESVVLGFNIANGLEIDLYSSDGSSGQNGSGIPYGQGGDGGSSGTTFQIKIEDFDNGNSYYTTYIPGGAGGGGGGGSCASGSGGGAGGAGGTGQHSKFVIPRTKISKNFIITINKLSNRSGDSGRNPQYSSYEKNSSRQGGNGGTGADSYYWAGANSGAQCHGKNGGGGSNESYDYVTGTETYIDYSASPSWGIVGSHWSSSGGYGGYGGMVNDWGWIYPTRTRNTYATATMYGGSGGTGGNGSEPRNHSFTISGIAITGSSEYKSTTTAYFTITKYEKYYE